MSIFHRHVMLPVDHFENAYLTLWPISVRATLQIANECRSPTLSSEVSFIFSVNVSHPLMQYRKQMVYVSDSRPFLEHFVQRTKVSTNLLQLAFRRAVYAITARRRQKAQK